MEQLRKSALVFPVLTCRLVSGCFGVPGTPSSISGYQSLQEHSGALQELSAGVQDGAGGAVTGQLGCPRFMSAGGGDNMNQPELRLEEGQVMGLGVGSLSATVQVDKAAP